MIIITLIKREFSIFIKNIHINLLLYFLFPIVIYLFIISSLSNLFDLIPSSGMNYSYHAIPSMIFLCTLMLAFITPIMIISRDCRSNYLFLILSSGIKNSNYFLSVIIYSIICSYIQFVITFILSFQLSDSGSKLGILLSWEQIFYFFIVIFPSILFFSSLGLIFSNFLNRLEAILISVVFLFLFISFGSCTFIPIDYYPSDYGNFVYNYNIVFHLYNMFILILKNGGISLGIFITAIVLSLILYSLNLFLFHKAVRTY